MDQSATKSIRRKPVPSANKPPLPAPLPPSSDDHDVLDGLIDDYLESPKLQQKYAPAIETKELKLDTRLEHPVLPSRQPSIPLVASPSEISEVSEISLNSSVSTPETPNPGRSIWKTAVDETIYFAGGLISHPFESTKHYSILRHSAAVVLYRGPSTSVTITVFADEPLPTDRSFWLQRKGFSGNMGMAASALLRTQGSWIEVTPSFETLASDVPPSDERAWQRDIKKFHKKTASHKHLSKQTARETCIIRIPASAEDGYLRIVMCTGEGSKKTLCPSPVFRVASTSSDVSVMRGASLSTMPLELGLKVASVVGTNVVDRYVGPARDAIQSKIEQYTPGAVAQEAGILAYEQSGIQGRVASAEEIFDTKIDVIYASQTEGVMEVAPMIIGADSGPEKPFPIRFSGKVVEGTGRSRSEIGIPTANLSGVPGDLLLRLSGVYIGWVAVQPIKGVQGISNDWHEAIITVGPSPYEPPRVVPKNVVAIHIIHDFDGATFFNANVQVIIMAYIRPIPKPGVSQPRDVIAAAIMRDINIAVASLSRDNWQCEMTLQRAKTDKSTRSFEERYVDVRTQVQKRVDSVPLHLAGVRTARAEVKDQAYGRGGLYIRR
ncbi:uncharacterized protein F4822DRAFT_372956 [Hypoxylon trugodes]|uniref:uncharacterized protein n=1 Tax=Hypoxylon trugodes TaxID=326681 RepID=UPI00219A1BEB|nr:uncharacterized protein F4822DRAFT_372956 [Hypoxylon trugodes]KAI1384766.1 hypothetical protein F4822DRAFT_372956 [Hypoxylon trugodes]